MTHGGVSFIDLDVSIDDIIRYIDKNATAIKQINITDFIYKYKIGDLEIDDVKLAFLEDTLVAISFDCTPEMLGHYISKYGNGRGRKYEYSFRKGESSDNNYKYECNDEEERFWSNGHVSMQYKYYFKHTDRPNYRNRISLNKSCIIYANGKFEEFVKILEEYKDKCISEKKSIKQASLDML